MGSFAAVLVLIACPAESSTCFSTPVRVLSYENAETCRAQRETEMRKASRAGFEIYGECNSFDGDLMAGKPRIDIKRNVTKLVGDTLNHNSAAALQKRAFYERIN